MIAPIHLPLAGCVSVCFKGEAGGGGVRVRWSLQILFSSLSLLIKVLIISTKKEKKNTLSGPRIPPSKRET